MWFFVIGSRLRLVGSRSIGGRRCIRSRSNIRSRSMMNRSMMAMTKIIRSDHSGQEQGRSNKSKLITFIRSTL